MLLAKYFHRMMSWSLEPVRMKESPYLEVKVSIDMIMSLWPPYCSATPLLMSNSFKVSPFEE